MPEDFPEERLVDKAREQTVYAPPKLTVHGNVTELTASGSQGRNESTGQPDNAPRM